jgi:transcriptional regulator with XRE-family HTH domain
MYLPENIRLLRKASGFSQKELSDKLQLSSNQVSKYEKGDAQPRIETLILLSQLFDVDVSDLILLDLSTEKAKARPATIAPKSEEEQDKMLNALNDLLMKRVMQIEEELKKVDPERARELGIE